LLRVPGRRLTAWGASRSQFAASIPVNDEDEEAAASAHVQSLMPKAGARMSFTAPQSLIAENEKEGEMVDPMEAHRASRVSDREDEYKARRRARIISPERHDPFAAGDQVSASAHGRRASCCCLWCRVRV